MDWDKVLRLLGAIFGLTGSILFTYGMMQVSPDDLWRQVGPRWDGNEDLIVAVAHEKASKTVGFHFVSVSFLFTAAGIFAPKTLATKWYVMTLTTSILLFGVMVSEIDRIYHSTVAGIRRAKVETEKAALEDVKKRMNESLHRSSGANP